MKITRFNTFRIIEIPSFNHLPRHRIAQIYDYHKIEAMKRSVYNRQGDSLIDHETHYCGKLDLSFLKKNHK